MENKKSNSLLIFVGVIGILFLCCCCTLTSMVAVRISSPDFRFEYCLGKTASSDPLGYCSEYYINR